jgi:hypothetical protein
LVKAKQVEQAKLKKQKVGDADPNGASWWNTKQIGK